MIRTLSLMLFALFSMSVHSAEIKRIVNQRSGEYFSAVCEHYVAGECQQVNFIYVHPKKQQERILMQLKVRTDSDLAGIDTTELDHFMFKLEREEMMRAEYDFLKTFHKVCMLYKNPDRAILGNERAGCFIKMLFGSIALGAGIASGSLSTTLLYFVLAGFMQSYVFEDLTLVQLPLFYPALAIDVLRMVTVLPAKKIRSAVALRRVQRVILPLLEELRYEIENSPTDQELESEVLVSDKFNHRITYVKTGVFRKIRRSFETFLLLEQEGLLH